MFSVKTSDTESPSSSSRTRRIANSLSRARRHVADAATSSLTKSQIQASQPTEHLVTVWVTVNDPTETAGITSFPCPCTSIVHRDDVFRGSCGATVSPIVTRSGYSLAGQCNQCSSAHCFASSDSRTRAMYSSLYPIQGSMGSEITEEVKARQVLDLYKAYAGK